jgi:FixJ family two-component response regulator
LDNSTTPITVYVIDDDDGVRRALARMFKSAGFRSHHFSTTVELLESDPDHGNGCVIADLNIVGDEPLKLPGRLEARSIDLPVVYISADDSDANRAKVQSGGGFGLFRKPVDDQALIDAVRWAVERQTARH